MLGEVDGQVDTGYPRLSLELLEPFGLASGFYLMSRRDLTGKED